jgi:uncharacterized protein YndB with AHSA1/START domain
MHRVRCLNVRDRESVRVGRQYLPCACHRCGFRIPSASDVLCWTVVTTVYPYGAFPVRYFGVIPDTRFLQTSGARNSGSVNARRCASPRMRTCVVCNQGRRLAVKITVETEVDAPSDEVWRAYTTPGDIMQWNAASDDWHTTAATVDLRVGGVFFSRMEAKNGSMGFDFAGTYTNIVKHQLIEYSFGDRAAKVEFANSPKGVRVRVTFDSEPTHSMEQQRDGWQAILNNFARHVEAGR